MCSEALGVSFRVEGENLRVRDIVSGQDHAWVEELQRNSKVDKAKIRATQARADAEAEARRQAEIRISELVALLRQSS